MKAAEFLDFDRGAFLAETDRELGLTPGFSAAQIKVESGDNPAAVSPRGAMGLAQVMPATLSTISKRVGRALNPFDERDALLVHREVMRENLGRFGNEDDAARAYNAGWKPETWGNPETSAYVPKIRRALGGQQQTPKPSGPSAASFLDAEDGPAEGGASAAAFLDAEEPASPPRSAGQRAADVGRSVGGAVVSALGAIPTALGKGVQYAGEMLTGVTQEEALALAGGDAAKGREFYERANTLNPVSRVGRGLGWIGDKINDQGQALRDGRSAEAKSLQQQSTPDGKLLEPSTWTAGADPSIEGALHVGSDVLGSLAPQVATAVATRGRSAATQVAAGAAVGGAQGTGAAIQEAREYLGKLSDEQLQHDSPIFREYLAAGFSAADARERLVRSAENHAAVLVAPVSTVGGAATGAILGEGFKNVGRTAVTRALLGAAAGGAEEGLQEVGEGVATRAGINAGTGMQRDLGEGTFGEFVLGAAGGGAIGGARGAMRGGRPAAPAIDAESFLDAEPAPAAPLALPAPVVRVDSEGNARRDGDVPPVMDEPAARVAGRASQPQVMPQELAALGYDSTPRASATPITVDAEGTARTDADIQPRATGMEPQARVVGRAEVLRNELEALGYEVSPPRAQQTPIAVDGRGNAATDEQVASSRPVPRDESLGDLPRQAGRAQVQPTAAQPVPGLAFDATQRATATPIAVDGEGTARVQGDQRSPDQATRDRLDAQAAQLFPKDQAKRAEWVTAQQQRELGYEARVFELAEKANSKRKARVAAAAPAAAGRPAKNISATSELGVVSRSNDDGSTTYFFASNEADQLTLGAAGDGGIRPFGSVTENAQAQSALLRAALADGPVAAGPRTLAREAIRGVQGAAVDRQGVTRIVGKDADRAKIAGELNRMAAKAATDRAQKTLQGTDLELAQAAIAADPRKAQSVLRSANRDQVVEALAEIAPAFRAESEDVAVPAAVTERQRAERLRDQGVGVDQDFVGYVTEAARDAVKAGHLTRDEFFAATRAAREGNREAAIEVLRKSDQRRGVASQPVLGPGAENIDPAARVDLEPSGDFASLFGEPDFMDDYLGDVASALTDSQRTAVSAAVRDVLDIGVPRSWLDGLQGIFNTSEKFTAGGRGNFFMKNLRGKPVRAISFKTTDSDSVIPAASASLAEQQEFRGQLIHELAHNADWSGAAMRSASEPRLAVNATDGSIEAVGDVAQEVFAAYAAGDGSDLAKLFAYPLRAAVKAAGDGRPFPNALVQSEVHAQVMRAYFTNPDALRQRAPKAYQYATDTIQPAAEGARADRAGQDLRDEVREEPDAGAGRDARRAVGGPDARGADLGDDPGSAGQPDGARRVQDEHPGPGDVGGRAEQMDSAGLESADAQPAVRRSGRADSSVEAAPREDRGASSPAADAADASLSRLADALSKDEGRVVRLRSAQVRPGSARARFAEGLKERFGTEIVYFESDDPAAPRGGAFVPGDATTIYVNAAQDISAQYVIGHEMTHALKEAHNDLWQGLMAALRRTALDTTANRADQEASYGRKVSDSLVEEENLSDVAGAAFKQDGFWAALQEELDAPALKRFFRWAVRWMDRLFGSRARVDLEEGGGFALAAEAMRMDLARAYAEAARRSPSVRSVAADAEIGVRRSNSSRLTAWAREALRGRANPSTTLAAERPSDPLRMAGVSWSLPIVIDGPTLSRHVAGKHPEVTPELVGRLPALLEAPRMVSANRDGGGYQVLVDLRDGGGQPILVALKPFDMKLGGKALKVTGVATMFGRQDSMNFVRDALREGRVKFMPEKELRRLEGSRFGEDSPLPSTPSPDQGSSQQAGTGAGFRSLSSSRSTPGSRTGSDNAASAIVLSDAALKAFHENPRGDWMKQGRSVSVPPGRVGADVKFTQRGDVADAPADQPSGVRRAAAAGAMAASKATAPITKATQVTNRVADRIGEEVARLTGVSRVGARAVSAVERGIASRSSWGWVERAKQGLVADYGLPEEYLDAKVAKQVRENKLLRQAKGTLDRLSSVTPDQLAVAYQWLQEKPDTARERDLLAKLEPAQRAVLQQMKADIDALSREAVALGLISEETYDRNAMAYVHRSYKKYEAELSSSQAVARQRAQRLKGDQFKGRGMELEAGLDRVRGNLPDDMQGVKLEMLEKRDAGGKLVRREYLVQGQPRPAALADYASAGIWEVRDATRGGRLKVWRDFTLAERQRMGEIEDARYGFARTMLQGVRDVETARFLDWAADNYAKDSDEGLDVVELSPMAAILGSQTFTPDEWVRVPDTKIKGTQVHRYGSLAGKYVPGIMYSDLTGVMEPRHNLWDQALSLWKISKTALSPAVHVNNVMANFVMADLADIGLDDIRQALQTLIAAKGGDKAAQTLIERYEDSGAESGSFAANEIKTAVLEPLLKQIAEGEPEAVTRASLAQVVSLAAHGSFKEAAVAATKTLPGRAAGATFDAMVKAYQSEDSVFRLAKFMTEVNAGKTDLQAGRAARDAFLNYDINAPWVRAARRSVLPFISFSYRAIPLLAKAVATKPWKFMKYAAVAEGLSMLAYMALGGDADREEEERLLPTEMQGSSLGLPKMLRMPWNDKDNDPLWLDVRRWLPAGDLVELNNKAALPVPQWLSIGGPLSLIVDLASNTDWRGEKIVQSTDTPGEAALKVTDTVAKFALPNLPTPGLGWVMRQVGAPVDTGQLDPYGWARIERGLSGAKTAGGKDIDGTIEVARALGVKLQPRPIADELRNLSLDHMAKEREITTDARRIARQGASGQIDGGEAKRRIARELEKLQKLRENTRKKVTPESN